MFYSEICSKKKKTILGRIGFSAFRLVRQQGKILKAGKRARESRLTTSTEDIVGTLMVALSIVPIYGSARLFRESKRPLCTCQHNPREYQCPIGRYGRQTLRINGTELTRSWTIDCISQNKLGSLGRVSFSWVCGFRTSWEGKEENG